jgi:hypothetical protein
VLNKKLAEAEQVPALFVVITEEDTWSTPVYVISHSIFKTEPAVEADLDT